MKKSHHFTELSDVQCNTNGCNRLLKEGLIVGGTKPIKQDHNIGKCYRCYEALAMTGMRRSMIPGTKADMKYIKALRFQFKLDRPADNTKTKSA